MIRRGFCSYCTTRKEEERELSKFVSEIPEDLLSFSDATVVRQDKELIKKDLQKLIDKFK